MKKTYKHLLVIISVLLTFVLIFVNAIAFKKIGFFPDTAYLIQQTIPSLIASLLVFICVYFFIEKFVDEQFLNISSIAALSSSETRRELFQERSTESLKSLSQELEAYRDKLKEEIVATLESAKTTSIDEGSGLDIRLKEMYLKLNDVELRLASIDEKLVLTTIDESDLKIKALTLDVQVFRLPKIINLA